MAGAADFQRSKTQCSQGHPYDEVNTRRTKDGRVCRTCKRDSERRRRLQPECRARVAKNMRKWREKHAEYNKKRHAQRRQKANQWLMSQRLACVKCGETHPAVLDFHHRNPLEKEFAIGYAVFSDLALARIKREIEKCDVLCANCHRKHHWVERQQQSEEAA